MIGEKRRKNGGKIKLAFIVQKNYEKKLYCLANKIKAK